MAKAENAGTTDGAAAPEASSADLDSLLDEWSDKPKPETDPTLRVLKEVKPVIDFAKQQQAKEAVDNQIKDTNAAVDFIVEPEEYKDFPKRWVKGFLEAYAVDNESFAEAFHKRSESPSNWQSELQKAREVFPEWVNELPGSKVRTDVEAAKATVSGTSTESLADDDDMPSAIELMQMSGSEWERHKERQLAKAAKR